LPDLLKKEVFCLPIYVEYAEMMDGNNGWIC